MAVAVARNVEYNSMARITRPKCRVCRRAGEKLFLKGPKCFTSKCPIVTRNYPPGMHGPTKGPAKQLKMTDFGKQMREKQKAKAMYFILEKQFRAYVDRAKEEKGDTSVILLNLLETRLDNAVYRMGFTPSRISARQLVGHGLIKVNGKKITIPSYQVKIGDVISFCATGSDKYKVLEESIRGRLKSYQLPSWVTINVDKLEGNVVSAVSENDFEKSFDTRQIIEFYSR